MGMEVRICNRSECGREIPSKDKRAKYCGRSCATSVNNVLYPKKIKQPRVHKPCKHCGEDNYNGNSFCSRVCWQASVKLNNDRYIEEWILGNVTGATPKGFLRKIVRDYLYEKAGYRCQSPTCAVPGGWSERNPVTGIVPLEIDHVDGDWLNNQFSNLMVLCRNCHSLTPTFASLNKGKATPGRVGRA